MQSHLPPDVFQIPMEFHPLVALAALVIIMGFCLAWLVALKCLVRNVIRKASVCVILPAKR